ncbi:MAG: GGDEF domain-containing protein, partial [Spirochaetota bacterium]|nr:GGDEF domain-containing protein [Spirochaetota bacterium]
ENLELVVKDRTKELQLAKDRAEKISAQIAEKNQVLAEMAYRDSLTGLYNHKTFMEHVEIIIHDAKRYNFPLSVVMIDIDFFKNINDKYGHQIGDEILKLVASILQKGIRKSDIASRYGGEEFTLILSHADEITSMDISERIRHDIENIFLPDIPELHITASLGISFFTDEINDDDGRFLVKRADEAMYSAKMKGRNQTFMLK